MSNSESDAAYFEKVVAEIEAEAERRTADGHYPRALLRSLDEEFRRWIPDTGRAAGVEDAIRSIEAAAYIDPGVPVESNKAVGRYVKTAVRKATYFYHRHMAQQIAALGIQVTRPLRLLDSTVRQLDARLAALEDRADVNVAMRDELAASVGDPDLSDAVHAAITDHLRDAPGRTLIGEITRSGPVAHLVDAGIDAYGVGPGLERHSSLELRDESLIEHLDVLDAGVLGGVVLIGATDRFNLNEQLTILDRIATRVADGGRVAIVVRDLDAWRSAVGNVGADLIQGRPLHLETWVHLLEREQMTVDCALPASADEPVACVLATVER